MSIHNIFSWPISTLLLFSQIRKPIFDGHFSNEGCSAFEALKKAFTIAPVLNHWILDTQITVEADVSMRATL